MKAIILFFMKYLEFSYVKQVDPDRVTWEQFKQIQDDIKNKENMQDVFNELDANLDKMTYTCYP